MEEFSNRACRHALSLLATCRIHAPRSGASTGLGASGRNILLAGSRFNLWLAAPRGERSGLRESLPRNDWQCSAADILAAGQDPAAQPFVEVNQ